MDSNFNFKSKFESEFRFYIEKVQFDQKLVEFNWKRLFISKTTTKIDNIGSNSTIDRGAWDDTIISSGVKIDNLVQIGHNCLVGENTIIAGCVGIAGSAKIGKNCAIGGAAMILGHLSITDNVTISPGSMITRSIKTSGTYTALMPFQDHETWLKTAAKIKRLK